MGKKNKNKSKQDGTTATLARVAGGIGIGLVAGLVGTAVMTAAQMIEMEVTGRESSDTPYKAVKKTFGVEAQTKEDKELVSNVTHIAYGSTWGIPRGIMAVLGTKGAPATGMHFSSVWGTELGLLPAMGVMQPVTEWKPKAIATDALFHSIYAVATGLTADALAKWLKRSYKKK